jgi:hypothetical protein
MRPYGLAESLWLGGFLDFWFRKNTVTLLIDAACIHRHRTGFTVFVILLGEYHVGCGVHCCRG